MNKIYILGILALLILAACAPTTPPPKMETNEEAPPAMEKETAPEPAPAETGRAPPPAPIIQTETQVKTETTTTTTTSTQRTSANPQLRDLLKRADEKLTSLQYLYGGTSTNNLFLDTYMVKGTKMKIRIYEENYYVREGYYDNIYFSAGASTGIGCCQELSRCKSANVDNTAKAFDVDLSVMTIPKTPYQWTKEIPEDAEIVGPQTFNERSVTFIKYSKDGAQYELLIDDTYGVPHRVLITDQNGNVVKHQFNDMLFNSLKDSDFVPPCK